MCGKTTDLWRIICLLRWVFVDLGKFMGENRPYVTARVPAITLTCQITTMLFVDHVLKQFYWSKTACDPIEYTLKGAEYWTYMPDSRSVTAAGGRWQHATCAQNSSPAERYFSITITVHRGRFKCIICCTSILYEPFLLKLPVTVKKMYKKSLPNVQ